MSQPTTLPLTDDQLRQVAEFAERLGNALTLAKPDLTCAEVDRRTHGIRPGRYLLVEHALRIVREQAEATAAVEAMHAEAGSA